MIVVSDTTAITNLFQGLHVIGLIGILLTAKRKGAIAEIKPILTILADVAGFRLHPSLVTDALKEAGEI